MLNKSPSTAYNLKLNYFSFIDAENLWILEQWLLYVQEMVQLKQREEELKLRVSEFEVNEEYKSLRVQLREVQNISARSLIASDNQVSYSLFPIYLS